MGQTKSRGWSPNCLFCCGYPRSMLEGFMELSFIWSHSSGGNVPPLLGHLCSPPFATLLQKRP